jgi:hypothetical protein
LLNMHIRKYAFDVVKLGNLIIQFLILLLIEDGFYFAWYCDEPNHQMVSEEIEEKCQNFRRVMLYSERSQDVCDSL